MSKLGLEHWKEVLAKHGRYAIPMIITRTEDLYRMYGQTMINHGMNKNEAFEWAFGNAWRNLLKADHDVYADFDAADVLKPETLHQLRESLGLNEPEKPRKGRKFNFET